MDRINSGDINRVLDQRYVRLIANPVYSKEELLHLLKDSDYDALNKILANESSRFGELGEYAELAEMYVEISPEKRE